MPTIEVKLQNIAEDKVILLSYPQFELKNLIILWLLNIFAEHLFLWAKIFISHLLSVYIEVVFLLRITFNNIKTVI